MNQELQQELSRQHGRILMRMTKLNTEISTSMLDWVEGFCSPDEGWARKAYAYYHRQKATRALDEWQQQLGRCVRDLKTLNAEIQAQIPAQRSTATVYVFDNELSAQALLKLAADNKVHYVIDRSAAFTLPDPSTDNEDWLEQMQDMRQMLADNAEALEEAVHSNLSILFNRHMENQYVSESLLIAENTY